MKNGHPQETLKTAADISRRDTIATSSAVTDGAFAPFRISPIFGKFANSFSRECQEQDVPIVRISHGVAIYPMVTELPRGRILRYAMPWEWGPFTIDLVELPTLTAVIERGAGYSGTPMRSTAAHGALLRDAVYQLARRRYPGRELQREYLPWYYVPACCGWVSRQPGVDDCVGPRIIPFERTSDPLTPIAALMPAHDIRCHTRRVGGGRCICKAPVFQLPRLEEVERMLVDGWQAGLEAAGVVPFDAEKMA